MAAKSIKLKIKGENWRAFKLNALTYEKKFGDDSDAITLKQDREIYFKKGHITMGTVRHELLHALVSETNTDSANLNEEQKEEICCSIMDFHWHELFYLTEIIIDKLVLKGM
jgi:hypothetical protein